VAGAVQHGADVLDQHLQRNRLANPGANAEVLRLLDRCRIGFGAEHDHRPTLAQSEPGQFAKEIEAIHRTHLVVADQQVEASTGAEVERFCPAMRHHHVVTTVLLQCVADDRSDDRVVVHAQHAGV
jgi:hypothetical protein